MQKVSPRRRPDSRVPKASWFSSARWANSSARLTGRLFVAKGREVRQANEVEGVKSDWVESSGDRLRADDQTDRSGRSLTRVVLFVPGPITEADLHRENLKVAATIRHRRRRFKRFQWLTENIGTIMFVTALLAVIWFVTGR
jgi:hypothetical protein